MELQGLLDSKKEYIQHLCDTLAEPMVLYFRRLYNDTMAKPEARGKSILSVFQEQLGSIAGWSNTLVREEFKIAQKRSGCKYIQDLIKAILVTNVKITLLSNSSKADCNRVKLRVPSAENFYHRCVLICAREVWKQPYLLYHKVRSLELQQNINELECIARKAIKAAVRGYLPFDQLVHDIKLEDQKTDSEPESSSSSASSASSSESSESESESSSDDDSDAEDAEDEQDIEVVHQPEPEQEQEYGDQEPEPEQEQEYGDQEPEPEQEQEYGDQEPEPEQEQEYGDPEPEPEPEPEPDMTVVQESNETESDHDRDADYKNIEILSRAPSSESSSDDEPESTDQKDTTRRKIILGSMLMKHHRNRHAHQKKSNAFF